MITSSDSINRHDKLNLVPENKYAQLMLVILSLCIVLGLWPELYPFYDLNDSSLHQIYSMHIADQLLSLQNPLDFFVEEWGCGFPLGGHYQSLPHCVLAVIHLFTLKLVPIYQLYHIVVVLLLALYPWSLYYVMKRFGLSDEASLAGAMLCLGVHSNIGFGHEFQSYIAIGTGLFSQIWAMHLFLWSLVMGYEFASGRSRGRIVPVLCFVLLGLSHVFLFYCTFLVLLLWWVCGVYGRRLRSLIAVIRLYVMIGLVLSFFLVPLVINADYHSFSRYERLGKIDSYGWEWVLPTFISGGLFDTGRVPVLTVLVVIGLFLSFRARSKPISGTLGISFLFSLVLFFGRTTWGPLINLLPFSRDLHFERFIVLVHFFGILLAGVSVAWFADYIRNMKRDVCKVFSSLVLVSAFCLVFVSTNAYLVQNRTLVSSLREAYHQDYRTENRLFDWIRRDDPKRLFAGKRSGWGTQFRLSGVPLYFLVGYHQLPVIGHLAFGWSLAGDFSEALFETRPAHLNLFNISHILSWRDDAYWERPADFSVGDVAVYRSRSGGWIELIKPDTVLEADKYNFWNVTRQWLYEFDGDSRNYLRICFDTCETLEYTRIIKPIDAYHFTLSVKDANGWRSATYAVAENQSLFTQCDSKTNTGRILEQSVAHGHWKATVQVDEPTVALLKLTYHPFWRARVNDSIVKPFMVSPAFVAVTVPPGKSRIEFFYQPPFYKWVLLLLGILVLCLLAMFDRIRPLEFSSTSQAKLRWRSALLFILGVCLLWLLVKSAPQQRFPLQNLASDTEQNWFNNKKKQVRSITITGFPFDEFLEKKLEPGELWMQKFQLDEKYDIFETWLGISDTSLSSSEDPKAIFSIVIDDQQVFESEAMRSGDLPKYCRLTITSAKTLTLQVKSMTPGGCIVATWARPSVR